MNNIVKIAFLSLSFIVSIPLAASAPIDSNNENYQDSEKEQFDWTPIMEAIIKVESEGNPNAVSGNSVGVMQITPILVKECNVTLERRKSDKRFSLNDRYSIEKIKREVPSDSVAPQQNKRRRKSYSLMEWRPMLLY